MQGNEVVAFVTLVVTSGITIASVAKAIVRRLELRDRAAAAPLARPAADAARLERIEQAVESIAVEVERISEGQRFTTRLLAERNDAALPRER